MSTSIVAERLTLEEFYREYEGRRAYLIDGVPYEMPPPNPPHSSSVTGLAGALRAAAPEGTHVRTENPLETGGANDPEPDIAILRGDERSYRRAHPTNSDALLVVEVADSTVSTDRRRKFPKYAEAGIPEVWLVNLVEGQVEVYREPASGQYSLRQIYRRGDVIDLLAGGRVRVDWWAEKAA